MVRLQQKEYLRENWADTARIIACILVVVGHMLQGLLASGLLAESFVSEWFMESIYFFHVPTFFFVSGYLYQKGSQRASNVSYGHRIMGKALSLGIPYFLFSGITYLTKQIFAGEVNTANDSSLLHTLFIEPISPYWFLYIIFFCFVMMISIRNRYYAIGFILVMLSLKVCSILLVWELPYIVGGIIDYGCFFALGMLLAYWKWVPKKKDMLGYLSLLFVPLTLIAYNRKGTLLELGMALLGILFVLYLSTWLSISKAKEMVPYLLPVYLMHTIFGAGVRIILLKLQIDSLLIHSIAGLLASFVLPGITYYVCNKTSYLRWVFYPREVTFTVRKFGRMKNEDSNSNR